MKEPHPTLPTSVEEYTEDCLELTETVRRAGGRQRQDDTDMLAMKRFGKKFGLPLLLLSLLLAPIAAQRPFDDFRNFRQRRPPQSKAEASGPSFGEYTFVRVIYESPYRGYGRGYGGGTWTTDYPEADNNFIVGLREWAGTNLKIAPRPEALEIMDERLFDFPLLYIVEPGLWN